MDDFPEYANLTNLRFIEELYGHFLEDPNSVDVSWRHFFEGMNFATGFRPQEFGCEHLQVLRLVQAYRRYGHLLASINPLEEPPESCPELDLGQLGFAPTALDKPFPTLGFKEGDKAPLKEILEVLQRIYCSRIGFEYMDIGDPELEKWIQKRIEPTLILELSPEEKRFLWDYLNRSEGFETFLHTRYVGQTRFSLEGNETALPMIAELIEYGAKEGIEEIWIGMAHRGRLNILANILNKPYATILEEFEDDTILSFFGNDDVKYHLGFMGAFQTQSGKKVRVNFPANPSHLESVDSVVLGQTRARQVVTKDIQKRRIVPLLIHGDAALAGQGVVYESMQLMHLDDYSVGGTIHLVLNNQIGYTTLPKEGRSTRYCTDIAKTFGAPVLHVNAEHPESCLFAIKFAVDLRQKFQCDIFLDLLGYRKYGHNEGDEPSFTQPIQYKRIRSKQSIRRLYLEQLLQGGLLEEKTADALETEYKEVLSKECAVAQTKEKKKAPPLQKMDLFYPIETGKEKRLLEEVLQKFCQIPTGFHPHPKLQKWLQSRLKMGEGKIDWATAEVLGIGSMLLEGISIRLAGQDSQRGTFSQRHMIWSDVENGSFYCPFHCLSKDQGRFDVVNSPLTEYAGLGFEYGYSCGAPETLVFWEAQYGDFINGAQILIDQYIATGEEKWNTTTSMVLLLPHGYQGEGPEHSSARVERFLQLAANENMQIVNASTPAQYFHVLRRQGHRKIKKPLILLTPKSLLRSSLCISPIQDCVKGSFQEILDDPAAPPEAKRVLLCSGKIYYDLLQERTKRKGTSIAILRIEQLYPLHEEKLKELLSRYAYTECIWVQEEPENMGAWSFLRSKLGTLVSRAELKRICRSPSATPATGSRIRHTLEQKALIEQALGGE